QAPPPAQRRLGARSARGLQGAYGPSARVLGPEAGLVGRFSSRRGAALHRTNGFLHFGRVPSPRDPGATVPTKITREVLESYLSCKLKGHLKLAGQDGTPCDYEGLLLGMRGVVKAKAAVRLRAGHPGEHVASGVPIAPAVLGQGWQVIL